jgi:Ca2+-binding EF-hand superfamily protein
MYILLIGRPPFASEKQVELLKSILKAKYSLPSLSKEGFVLSEDAEFLLGKMLSKDESKRFSAEDCLQNAWIAAHSEIPLQPEERHFALKQLRLFQEKSVVHKLITTAMACQLGDGAQCSSQCLKLFKYLDTDGDGSISVRELEQGLDLTESRTARDFMDAVDTDGSAEMDYTELLACMLGQEDLCNPQNLLNVFQLFDKDKNGSLSASELLHLAHRDLKEIAGVSESVAEAERQKLIDEIIEALSGCGVRRLSDEIDFDDFSRLMR